MRGGSADIKSTAQEMPCKISKRKRPDKGREGKRTEREDGGWIIESLKGPKVKEAREKEWQEKGGWNYRPRENGEDLVTPNDYSDLD